MDVRTARLWIELCEILREAPEGYMPRQQIPDYLRVLLNKDAPHRDCLICYYPSRGWRLKNTCTSKLQSLKRLIEQRAA